MRKLFSEYANLSFKNVVLLLGVLVLATIFVIFDAKRNIQKELPTPIVHSIVTPIPTVTIYPRQKGFHGYDDKKAWFDFALPPECAGGMNKKVSFEEPQTITCKTTDFTVIIDPQTGGRGGKVTERKEIALNGMSWSETVLDNDRQYDATYQLDAKENTYLIGVKYKPATPEAQHYFETILASFHFID